jgi:hypothetical protein
MNITPVISSGSPARLVHEIKPQIASPVMATLLPVHRVSATVETLRVQPSSQRCEDEDEAPTPEKTQEKQHLMPAQQVDQQAGEVASAPPSAPVPVQPQAPSVEASAYAPKISARTGYHDLPRAEQVIYARYAERALDSENGRRMREVFSLVHVLAHLLETNSEGVCTPPMAPHGSLGWD